MKRVTVLASAAALAIGVVAGAVLAQQAQGPQPFFVGQPSRPADQPGAGWHVRGDVAQRQGLRRDLLR